MFAELISGVCWRINRCRVRHGCVHLTNWDAQELAKMVHRGTKVEFTN